MGGASAAAVVSEPARYLSCSSREPCFGCSERMTKWYGGDQAEPRPPAVRMASYRRVRDGKEWLLCPEHKHLWEVHDMEAKRWRPGKRK